ncbi:lariat debranching enzyme, C-terminal domain-containing protein [Gilbertella persicaria]|uniref:lariat debranching enzyme, C-terminal domain-containing protein n=1 Tax=Gilbertella persicaria TaxID=101096 RepID=UPI002220F755|nr:lariat debranching enzyme, C-terminal domain-containing protein [Gilbertella persicaria]KAI8068155.1 lariat debranching enzyme, C-terminal domain-containing protein [Gilbertella persicaria]
MKIAIEGCCHGQLDDIYGSIRLVEEKENCKIDLVLICGDFQAIRNESDMYCMAVPPKYRNLGTFWKYYTGQARAPYPTIFIGGNHEASNYLWELYHGGWVCDNIYYLGHAGVIEFGGLRIGGLSGIAKENHYKKGHYEKSPYNQSDIRSAYHVREYDVQKLLQIKEPMDIFLSHDWPRGVERYGDLGHLMKIKEYFVSEIMSNTLGSYPNELILSQLKPSYWFSAHLHVHYAAIVRHDMWQKGQYPPKTQAILDQFKPKNPDEIILDEDDIQESSEENSTLTKFLSLDKCLPKRQFLQIIDIPSPNDANRDYDFYYDMEWLSITRAMHPFLSTGHQQTPLPSHDELKALIEKERAYLVAKQESNSLDLKIPHNFEATAPGYMPGVQMDRQAIWDNQYPFLNPQTVEFCKEIDIENKINNDCRQERMPMKRMKIESEIVIDEEDL